MIAEITSSSESTISTHRPLYLLSVAAALVMDAIIIIQLAVFMTVPPPLEGTVTDWFRLFQSNPLAGLIDFELLMVIYALISIPISAALYLTLKKDNLAFMVLYLALSVTGAIAFTAARPALEMLYLSNGYAAATTEAEKTIFLAAGQSLNATFHGTAFQVSYLLGSINGLIVSAVMLRSQLFSKATAAVRIASSVCDFGLYIPTIGIYISIFSVLFLFIWNILVARRLYQFGQQSR